MTQHLIRYRRMVDRSYRSSWTTRRRWHLNSSYAGEDSEQRSKKTSWGAQCPAFIMLRTIAGHPLSNPVTWGFPPRWLTAWTRIDTSSRMGTDKMSHKRDNMQILSRGSELLLFPFQQHFTAFVNKQSPNRRTVHAGSRSTCAPLQITSVKVCCGTRRIWWDSDGVLQLG